MSIRIMSLVWRAQSGFFTSTEKIVLLRMSDFAADDGSSVYPSLSRVSEETELSKRAVQKSIVSMLQKGAVELVKQFSAQANKPNIYHINVELLETLTRDPIAPRSIAPIEPGAIPYSTTFTQSIIYNHHISIRYMLVNFRRWRRSK